LYVALVFFVILPLVRFGLVATESARVLTTRFNSSSESVAGPSCRPPAVGAREGLLFGVLLGLVQGSVVGGLAVAVSVTVR